jgi:hypothetical protein
VLDRLEGSDGDTELRSLADVVERDVEGAVRDAEHPRRPDQPLELRPAISCAHPLSCSPTSASAGTSTSGQVQETNLAIVGVARVLSETDHSYRG